MKFRVLGVVILTLLSTSPVFSQEKPEEKERKGFIGVSIGPAFPVGNFGSNNWNNENSGFATTGYQFAAIDFGIKFVPNFGLAGSFKGANIPLDVQTIANSYASEYGGQFSVKSSRWNYGGIYVGPFVSIPTKYVEFDIKFTTGLMLAFIPDLEIRRGFEYYNQESTVGPSISITVGADIRVHLSKRFSIKTGAEYMRARPVFYVEYTSNTSFESETVYQDINAVNASMGIVLRIF